MYLFDPAAVSERLVSLPHLRDALGDPSAAGEASGAFQHARKSERQIYRVLGNAHYEHLEALLATVDRCLERGFLQPQILRTRAHRPFADALAELHAAGHFVLRDFAIEGLDATKGEASVPDLLIRGRDLEIAVEVYSPLEWEGLWALPDDAMDLLKNLDLPWDYRFEVRLAQLERFEDGRMITLHPAEISDRLSVDVRQGMLGEVGASVTEQLRGEEDLRVECDRPALNLGITVELDHVRPTERNLPARTGAIHYPSITGYAPDAMFDRLVGSRIRRKAAKGQAVDHAALALLLVDLSRSEIQNELREGYYRECFCESLERHFSEGLSGYDVVALCEPVGWNHELHCHFAVVEEHVDSGVPKALFSNLGNA